MRSGLSRHVCLAALLLLTVGGLMACTTTRQGGAAPETAHPTRRAATAQASEGGGEPEADSARSHAGTTPTDDEADPAALKTRIVPGSFVSTSRGQTGGLLLLYPRIIPSASAGALSKAAHTAQESLRLLLAEAYPTTPLDVRPEGERVCIKTGCLATSVGILLVSAGSNCVAVISVTAPGIAEHRLFSWAGKVVMTPRVPFREFLESYVKVVDMVACDALGAIPPEVLTEVHAAIAATL